MMSLHLCLWPQTEIGCLVLSQTGMCVMHQDAIADVINAAHEYIYDGEVDAGGRGSGGSGGDSQSDSLRQRARGGGGSQKAE